MEVYKAEAVTALDLESPGHAAKGSLEEVLAELVRREPIFHREEFGRGRADFEAMMVEDFWEIGASGRQYTREFVLEEMERRYGAGAKEYEDDWAAKEFRCRRLAGDVYLLTYTLIQNQERETRRSTIWEKTDEGWKIVFHQGTAVAGGS